MRLTEDQIHKLTLEALANLQLRTRQHLTVLGKNRIGDIQPRRLGDGKQEDGALQSGRV